MNIHEFQSKILLRQRKLPVPAGVVIEKEQEAKEALKGFLESGCVIKAQIHAGGRGKAGGVRLVKSEEIALKAVQDLLHQRLKTNQTDLNGQPIDYLLIEPISHIKKEFYLGIVLDRSQRSLCLMVSSEGGMEIEQVAQEQPEKLLKVFIDPLVGILPSQCRELAFGLGFAGNQIQQFECIATGLVNFFVEKDCSLIEINPLVLTQEGNLLCLDAKIAFDDNALFRHPDIKALRDERQEDPRELLAREWDLNYVALDGVIGCMVNGAGLAMATMDIVQLFGAKPANFLDVGGSATQERVTQAFKIILSDPKVKAVLVNIFGGIVRCDLIAEGVIRAVAEVGISLPVIVRLEGTRSKEAAALLKQSGLKLISAHSLSDAAKKAVEAAQGELV